MTLLPDPGPLSDRCDKGLRERMALGARWLWSLAWRPVEPWMRAIEASFAALVFGFPAFRLKVIGVTGTDGKTTTCHLIAATLEAAGLPVGVVSTVSGAVVSEAEPFGRELTTPDPWAMQRLLREMVRDGAHWAVVEATSHGLALQRLAWVPLEVAVLTNVSRDHLDFHGSMDDYVTAKMKLFKRRPRLSVLTRETAFADRFEHVGKGRRLYYGLKDGDVVADDIVPAPTTAFTLRTPIGTRHVRLRSPGVVQARNALAAAAVGVGIGLELDQIVHGLEHAPELPGRIEWVAHSLGDFKVVIDHAHTEDALAALYGALRPLARGRLVAVLGIDGDRDSGKRSALGRKAGEMCEFVVLTTTHPRSESPEAIVEQLRKGLDDLGRRPGVDYEIIIDRREAIFRSLAGAQDGDVVVLTGIGHEPYLASERGKLPWNERAAVEQALSELQRL